MTPGESGLGVQPWAGGSEIGRGVQDRIESGPATVKPGNVSEKDTDPLEEKRRGWNDRPSYRGETVWVVPGLYRGVSD